VLVVIGICPLVVRLVTECDCRRRYRRTGSAWA